MFVRDTRIRRKGGRERGGGYVVYECVSVTARSFRLEGRQGVNFWRWREQKGGVPPVGETCRGSIYTTTITLAEMETTETQSTDIF